MKNIINIILTLLLLVVFFQYILEKNSNKRKETNLTEHVEYKEIEIITLENKKLNIDRKEKEIENIHENIDFKSIRDKPDLSEEEKELQIDRMIYEEDTRELAYIVKSYDQEDKEFLVFLAAEKEFISELEEN
jgi:uncharacterized protein YxeA